MIIIFTRMFMAAKVSYEVGWSRNGFFALAAHCGDTNGLQ